MGGTGSALKSRLSGRQWRGPATCGSRVVGMALKMTSMSEVQAAGVGLVVAVLLPVHHHHGRLYP
jgi:hypothetical protein